MNRYQCADYARLFGHCMLCGCYDNGTNQIVQKILITEISKTIQASLMKLGIYTDGNVLIMHVIFFRRHMKILVAMVKEKVKMLQKHNCSKTILD